MDIIGGLPKPTFFPTEVSLILIKKKSVISEVIYYGYPHIGYIHIYKGKYFPFASLSNGSVISVGQPLHTVYIHGPHTVGE